MLEVMPGSISPLASRALGMGEASWAGKVAVALGLALGTWLIVLGVYFALLGPPLPGLVHLPWLGWLVPHLVIGNFAGASWGLLWLALGIAWIAIANVYLFQNTPAAWRAMVILALICSACLGGLDVIVAGQILLLCVPSTRRALAVRRLQADSRE